MPDPPCVHHNVVIEQSYITITPLQVDCIAFTDRSGVHQSIYADFGAIAKRQALVDAGLCRSGIKVGVEVRAFGPHLAKLERVICRGWKLVEKTFGGRAGCCDDSLEAGCRGFERAALEPLPGVSKGLHVQQNSGGGGPNVALVKLWSNVADL